MDVNSPDRLPILLLVGDDDRSVRAFRRRTSGISSLPNFYRMLDKYPSADQLKAGVLFIDAETGSGWNFQGCAISRKLVGRCLEQVDILKLLVRLAQL